MKKIILLVAVLAAALVVPSAVSSAAGPPSPSAQTPPGPSAQTSKSSAVHDCAWATRHTRFAAIRVKKVRKRVVNGQLPVWKLKASLRIYKAALRYKNQVCAPGGGGPHPGPGQGNPTPLALSASEVQNRVLSRASGYCDEDNDCVSYGAYAINTCHSFSTYQAVCYGWNDEDGTFSPPFARCSFREVVSRSGYNGITSYHDTSYGESRGGWVCV